MIIIAHRGNLNGPNPEMENSVVYIEEALRKGFDVEVDVRSDDYGHLYLGHDFAAYPVSVNFLKRRHSSIWCHAKDYKALRILLKNDCHCFWHDNDDMTVTNRGFVWSFPGKAKGWDVVAVDKNAKDKKIFDKLEVGFICTDYALELKK